jgi:hypothetical protein
MLDHICDGIDGATGYAAAYRAYPLDPPNIDHERLLALTTIELTFSTGPSLPVFG